MASQHISSRPYGSQFRQGSSYANFESPHPFDAYGKAEQAAEKSKTGAKSVPQGTSGAKTHRRFKQLRHDQSRALIQSRIFQQPVKPCPWAVSATLIEQVDPPNFVEIELSATSPLSS